MSFSLLLQWVGLNGEELMETKLSKALSAELADSNFSRQPEVELAAGVAIGPVFSRLSAGRMNDASFEALVLALPIPGSLKGCIPRIVEDLIASETVSAPRVAELLRGSVFSTLYDSIFHADAAPGLSWNQRIARSFESEGAVQEEMAERVHSWNHVLNEEALVFGERVACSDNPLPRIDAELERVSARLMTNLAIEIRSRGRRSRLGSE